MMPESAGAQPPVLERTPGVVKVAVVLALFQAAFTSVMVVVAAIDGHLLAGQDGFSLLSLLDAIVLSGLAISLFKRRLWAGYALAGYGILDYTVKVLNSGSPSWVLPLIAYLAGAIVLHRQKFAVTPRFVDVNWRAALAWAALWTAGNFVIGFILGFAGLTKGGAPISPTVALAQYATYMLWGVYLSYAAAHRAAWPLETVLLIAALSVPIGLVDLLFVRMSPLALASRFIWFLAPGFVGLAVALTLPRSRASVVAGTQSGSTDVP